MMFETTNKAKRAARRAKHIADEIEANQYKVDEYEMYHDPLTGRDMWINTAYADDDIDAQVDRVMGI